MLRLTIKEKEFFNNETQEFLYIKETTISLEHSLVSVSKWESKWKKPYLSNKLMTREETIDYIRCMTITQNVNPLVYEAIGNDEIKAVQDYIDDKMTATFFRETDEERSVSVSNSHRVITSEVIYYWMIAYGIPVEFQKWHLNRLLTLIQVCQEKNKPQKKRSKSSVASEYRRLNAERRKKFHTKG